MVFLIVVFVFLGWSSQPAVEVITDLAKIKQLRIQLHNLEKVRNQQPDPDSNPSKRIYAEEMFKFRMIDTLATIYPVIQNGIDSTKLAKMDSVIALFAHADSTDDRGKKTRTRLLKWLELSLAERKQRIKAQRFVGKMAYASRNELIAVVEQFNYAMFADDMPLKQVVKKLAIGRLYENQGATKVGYRFPTTAEFDNKLSALRTQYFESDIR